MDKGASVVIPYVIGTSGADYDLWTALVTRFADEGLDEVQPRAHLHDREGVGS